MLMMTTMEEKDGVAGAAAGTTAVDNDDGQTNGRHVSSHYAFKRCKQKRRE